MSCCAIPLGMIKGADPLLSNLINITLSIYGKLMNIC
jgi:hypothetical protein